MLTSTQTTHPPNLPPPPHGKILPRRRRPLEPKPLLHTPNLLPPPQPTRLPFSHSKRLLRHAPLRSLLPPLNHNLRSNPRYRRQHRRLPPRHHHQPLQTPPPSPNPRHSRSSKHRTRHVRRPLPPLNKMGQDPQSLPPKTRLSASGASRQRVLPRRGGQVDFGRCNPRNGGIRRGCPGFFSEGIHPRCKDTISSRKVLPVRCPSLMHRVH